MKTRTCVLPRRVHGRKTFAAALLLISDGNNRAPVSRTITGSWDVQTVRRWWGRQLPTCWPGQPQCVVRVEKSTGQQGVHKMLYLCKIAHTPPRLSLYGPVAPKWVPGPGGSPRPGQGPTGSVSLAEQHCSTGLLHALSPVRTQWSLPETMTR